MCVPVHRSLFIHPSICRCVYVIACVHVHTRPHSTDPLTPHKTNQNNQKPTGAFHRAGGDRGPPGPLAPLPR